MRGAQGIARAIAARDRRIVVVGVPKTIDNDIPFIGHSFGFQTAFGKATESIRAAHTEATAQPGGIGLVQLMDWQIPSRFADARDQNTTNTSRLSPINHVSIKYR